MSNIKKAAAVAVALAALLLTTAGSCDESHESGPEPAPGSFVNIPNGRGFKAPEGYRNILAFCDGPNMVYETSRGSTSTGVEGTTSSSIYVVPNDPRCTGKTQ